jgi:hypothetical protein
VRSPPPFRRPYRFLAAVSAVGIAVCIFVGFWAFVYQGYKEDTGSEPTQSWPIGVGAFAIAVLLAIVAARNGWPGLKAWTFLLLALLMCAGLAAVAVGALDAGSG